MAFCWSRSPTYNTTATSITDASFIIILRQNVLRPNGAPLGGGNYFWVAPTRFLLTDNGNTGDFYLYRRGNKFSDPDNYTSIYGYGGTIYDFLGGPYIIMASNLKVGIAFREINGERFALVVYDVTNPEMTS